jgi:nicotinate-nucleotide pyrophosphorylase (carboxylating)
MVAKAQIMAKEAMIVAGITVAEEVFHQIDNTLTLNFHQRDGDWVAPNTRILTITGNAQSLLQAERVALNFMQRLSGISTITHQFCHAVHDHSVKIADTRKTTPGLRALEKWAVRLGGGFNHRFSLHDGILIKDNHLMVLAANNISLSQACQLAKQQAPHGLRISVEVESLAQVREALHGKADIILFDNMSPSKIQQAVKTIKGQALVEVSGGITLRNIQDIANMGIDIVSIGALTHSAPAMDLSMDIIPAIPQRKKKKR